MRMTPEALDLIKEGEALRLEAYPDPRTGGEPWTIGYGHTGTVDGRKVHRGMKITEAKANELFRRDVVSFADSVRALVKVPLSDQQFGALVSLAFNIGAGAVSRSKTLQFINAGEFENALSEWVGFVNPGSNVERGLARRRAKEGRMFMPGKIAYNHHSLVPPDEWKWPNFSPAELACKGTGRIMLDIDALDALQRLRHRLGKPLLITSAYRSPEHNKRVGGAKNSFHMKGVAFDVQMANHDPVDFEKTARAEGFRGFGYYPKSGFMHIDTGPARTWGKKFPPRPTRFEEERKPVEEVENSARAKGAGAAAGAGLGTAVIVESARQAQEVATAGKGAIDAIASYGPWVLAAVLLAVGSYFAWRWYRGRGEV